MRQHGPATGRIENADSLVHEQHLIGPRRHRPVANPARLIVEVDVHEVEVALEQAHQPEEWVAESQIASCLDFLGRLADTLAAR